MQPRTICPLRFGRRHRFPSFWANTIVVVVDSIRIKGGSIVVHPSIHRSNNIMVSTYSQSRRSLVVFFMVILAVIITRLDLSFQPVEKSLEQKKDNLEDLLNDDAFDFVNNHNNNESSNMPQVAWIMSFGGSVSCQYMSVVVVVVVSGFTLLYNTFSLSQTHILSSLVRAHLTPLPTRNK